MRIKRSLLIPEMGILFVLSSSSGTIAETPRDWRTSRLQTEPQTSKTQGILVADAQHTSDDTSDFFEMPPLDDDHPKVRASKRSTRAKPVGKLKPTTADDAPKAATSRANYFTLKCPLSGVSKTNETRNSINWTPYLTIDLRKRKWKLIGTDEIDDLTYDDKKITLSNEKDQWQYISRDNGEMTKFATIADTKVFMTGVCEKVDLIPFDQKKF